MMPQDTPTEFYDKLQRDQIDRYQTLDAKHIAMLDEWMQANVLHVMEQCPKTLELWRATQRGSVFYGDTILYRYFSAALEHLDDLGHKPYGTIPWLSLRIVGASASGSGIRAAAGAHKLLGVLSRHAGYAPDVDAGRCSGYLAGL